MTSAGSHTIDGDAVGTTACAGSCPKNCGPDVVAALRRENEELRRELDELRIKLNELGLMALLELSQAQKHRIIVVQMLREKHKDIKVTPNSLHTLKPHVQRDAMDWLYAAIGDGPKTKDQVNEVFRAPRSPRRRQEDFY